MSKPAASTACNILPACGYIIASTSIGAAKTWNNAPALYRLLKKSDGSLVLQGCYHWQQGFNSSGHEWRDIPTIEE